MAERVDQAAHYESSYTVRFAPIAILFFVAISLMMFHARIASLLLTILFYTCAAFGALPDLPNAPVQAFGIVKGRDLNGREVFAADDGQAKLAADAQFAPANASQALVDRSLELVDRQTCSPGYGYCSGECSLHIHRPNSKL